MKNSKVLSLLTAGALVVSSFSGLAMNGGVAKAADVGGLPFALSSGDFYTDNTFAIKASTGATEVYVKHNATGLQVTGRDAAGGTAFAKGGAFVGAATKISADGADMTGGSATITAAEVAGIKFTPSGTGTATPVYSITASPWYMLVNNLTTTQAYINADLGSAGHGNLEINVVNPDGQWIPKKAEVTASSKATLAIDAALLTDMANQPTANQFTDVTTVSTDFDVKLSEDKKSVEIKIKDGQTVAAGTYNVAVTAVGGNAAGNALGTVAVTVKVPGGDGTAILDSIALTYKRLDKSGNLVTVTDPELTFGVTNLEDLYVSGEVKAKANGSDVKFTDVTFGYAFGPYKQDGVDAVTAAGQIKDTEQSDKTTHLFHAQTAIWPAGNTKPFKTEVTVTATAIGTVGTKSITYTGTTQFTLTYYPTPKAATLTVSPTDANSTKFVAGDVTGRKFTATVTDVRADLDETKFYYVWTVTPVNDEPKDAIDLGEAKKHQNYVTVGVVSGVGAGFYDLNCTVYENEARFLSEVRPGANALAALATPVRLTVKNPTLDVTVSTSAFGESGYVTAKKTSQKFADAVSAKRASGVDIAADDCEFYVVGYSVYQENLEANTLENLAVAGNKSNGGVSVSNGTVTVAGNPEPGAYAVIAKDTKFGTIGAAVEPIVVRSEGGVAATGLELDYNDVVITNFNEEAKVYATVLPVNYKENGYRKIEATSAEIYQVIATSSDPSVAEVYVIGTKKKFEKTEFEMDNTQLITVKGKKAGEATVTVTTVDGGFTKTFDVTVRDGVNPEPTPEPEPEPEHKAGDAFTVDGVSVFVNADGKTLTVTDVTVVGKTATIPAIVDGMDVTTIAAQAFKKSDAKTIYVKAAVTDIEKGAFKAAKVKKVFFYQPEALKTVGKNAFKKTNAKVVGVGGAFSDDAASQLKKAGASKVKNNGSAK